MQTYESDFVVWADQQSKALTNRVLSEIDFDNLAEELDTLSRSQQKEFRNRLRVLMIHLLKWKYQAKYLWADTRATASWYSTIIEERSMIETLIEVSPSLKSKISETMDASYQKARLGAALQTGLPEATFPLECEWSFSEIFDLQLDLS